MVFCVYGCFCLIFKLHAQLLYVEKKGENIMEWNLCENEDEEAIMRQDEKEEG